MTLHVLINVCTKRERGWVVCFLWLLNIEWSAAGEKNEIGRWQTLISFEKHHSFPSENHAHSHLFIYPWWGLIYPSWGRIYPYDQTHISHGSYIPIFQPKIHISLIYPENNPQIFFAPNGANIDQIIANKYSPHSLSLFSFFSLALSLSSLVKITWITQSVGLPVLDVHSHKSFFTQVDIEQTEYM